MEGRAEKMLLTAAAAFEDGLDEVLDVEAGLRDVLLQTHYDGLEDELDEVLDVDAGLAQAFDKIRPVEIPGGDGLTIPAGSVPEQSAGSTAPVVLAVRSTAELINDLAYRIFRVEAVGHRASLNRVTLAADRLVGLSDGIEDGTATLDEAYAVITETADAIKQAYDEIVARRYSWSEVPGPLTELRACAARAEGLWGPIKRLFDPSDHTVESLL